VLEKKYLLTQTNNKLIEKVILDENLNYMHMVLPKNDRLPEHYANSNVYMTVIRGIVSLQLDDQELKKFEKGSIIVIPYKTKMNVVNYDEEVLEITVVKVPSPDKIK